MGDTYVRILTDAEWAVLAPLLDEIGTGALLVPPAVADKFAAHYRVALPSSAILQYDNDGVVDVAFGLMSPNVAAAKYASFPGQLYAAGTELQRDREEK